MATLTPRGMDPYVEMSQEDRADAPYPRHKRWVKVAIAVVAASALLVFVFVTGHLQNVRALTSNLEAPLQDDQIIVPPRQKCAKIGSNCMAFKCCRTSGYTCYEVEAGLGKCMKECIPGVNGTCITQTLKKPSKKSTISRTSNTLFCFTFYTKYTGSTKPSYELELLRTQLFLGAGVFGCESYKVYSDVETWLSPGQVDTVKVHDDNNDFYFAKRKKTGTWINSNIFIAVWKKIGAGGLWTTRDWTVKVDADAVFLPSRLREKLGTQEVTDNGIYLENCKYVNYGFFGNLEVFSHQAASIYIQSLDDCKASLNYMGSEKDTGFEGWGEDLFAQRCMDLHGVDKVPRFDITTDGACAALRPEGQKKNTHWKPDCATVQTPAMHPFKKPVDYFKCLTATQR